VKLKSFRFKCLVEYAKRSFYRSAIGIFGKVGSCVAITIAEMCADSSLWFTGMRIH